MAKFGEKVRLSKPSKKLKDKGGPTFFLFCLGITVVAATGGEGPMRPN